MWNIKNDSFLLKTDQGGLNKKAQIFRLLERNLSIYSDMHSSSISTIFAGNLV